MTEIKLNGRRPPQNLNRNLQAALFVIHLFNDSTEVVEWAIGDPDHLARLEQDLRPRLVDTLTNALQYLICFLVRDRRRPVTRTTNKAEHLRYLFDEVPGLVIHFHLYEHVARKELALTATLLSFLHLDHFLGRDKYFTKLVFQSHALDALLEGRFHLVFEIRIGVNDVPP